MIKISAGLKKGKTVQTSRNLEFRPTSGKVREALFNILGNKIPGAVFLDLFAGSGSVGIEALSRGAGHCTFVEHDQNHFQILKTNIENFKLGSSADLFYQDAFRFNDPERRYDVLYLDPPYADASRILEKLLPPLGRSDMIQKNGIVVIEHFKKTELKSRYGPLVIKKQYAYGDTRLTLFSCADPAGHPPPGGGI